MIKFAQQKNPDSSPVRKQGEELPGLQCKINKIMAPDKNFFEKVFSQKRMERYFMLYPSDEMRAISHYECNLKISEAIYISLSVFEVTLRNALCRELEKMAGRPDWYVIFPQTPGLTNLNRYITKAVKQISARHEQALPSKVIAELTLGFWVTLLNSEYERILWKDLRRAFPNMPKSIRQRKNISAPLNRFRMLRNRVFHNESICWNLSRINEIHEEIIKVLGWMNNEVPDWLSSFDRFNKVRDDVANRLNWKIQ